MDETLRVRMTGELKANLRRLSRHKEFRRDMSALARLFIEQRVEEEERRLMLSPPAARAAPLVLRARPVRGGAR